MRRTKLAGIEHTGSYILYSSLLLQGSCSHSSLSTSDPSHGSALQMRVRDRNTKSQVLSQDPQSDQLLHTPVLGGVAVLCSGWSSGGYRGGCGGKCYIWHK